MSKTNKKTYPISIYYLNNYLSVGALGLYILFIVGLIAIEVNSIVHILFLIVKLTLLIIFFITYKLNSNEYK